MSKGVLHTKEFARIRKHKTTGTWRTWGPYLSERQWGTVREDYSEDGSSWGYITHEKSRSNAYRWGEEGIAGISDNKQNICFAWSFWNHHDSIIKERLFGLSNPEGNHGEDVKEIYAYKDNVPSHSYMRYDYIYPCSAFPYETLVSENAKRTKQDDEFELIDTGILDGKNYFRIEMVYAKIDDSNFAIKIRVHNASSEIQKLYAMPTLWLRNRWSNGRGDAGNYKINRASVHRVDINHPRFVNYRLESVDDTQWVFCDNETNEKKVYGMDKKTTQYTKDGINDWLLHKDSEAANLKSGSKVAGMRHFVLNPGETREAYYFLGNGDYKVTQSFLVKSIAEKKTEADEFYAALTEHIESPSEKELYRDAISGLLWNKQHYNFNLYKWINGDPNSPIKPKRSYFRNNDWLHLNNSNIISVPDKWEYPWYAAWDLAFQVVPLARVDPEFAKRQLSLLLREYYMHPNGQIPAYEWNFSDVNPPVHAWATWEVYQIDKALEGEGDFEFLEKIFQKLLVNFTWWVNQKDVDGKNAFEGGFLGLDNIGVFDRSNPPEEVESITQADATSWMAMYCLNMMHIAVELSKKASHYEEMASKFFQHFMFIGGAMAEMGDEKSGLWDEEAGFYFDEVEGKDGLSQPMKVKSIVGLVPLFAVEVLSQAEYEELETFKKRVEGFIRTRPDLSEMVSKIMVKGPKGLHLASVVRSYRLYKILQRVLDENEFLSPYGIRSMSRDHKDNPFEIKLGKSTHTVAYESGESRSHMFGGNSNWRGPIWYPINFLLVKSLRKFEQYYGNDYTYEFPTHSGQQIKLNEVIDDITRRLVEPFISEDLPQLGFRKDRYKENELHDIPQFFEYFDGDNGMGLGSAHQSGWTALVAELLIKD